MLQDAFVEKDGSPMAGGTITCFEDSSRTTLKNWYYQSSNFADAQGNYTFSKLPNPLTLSAAGTITDINGVDTIPFFYPFSELDQTESQPYYITIVNHDMTNQITRPNFPYNRGTGGNPSIEGSVENYIINNGFWRNIGTLTYGAITNQIVAPSQHDGFRYPDIQFIRDVTTGTDTVTFNKFPLSLSQTLTGDITPEYYLNHNCSTPGGETQKAYLFPISLHVNTLNAVPCTITIQAQNLGGGSAAQSTINLFIYQDTGSGTTAPAPFPVGSILLNTGWQKYEFSTSTPDTAGLTLSNGGDDALYLMVQMPINVTCNINFTKPSFYLLEEGSPTNSFSTYDEVDAIINSPRTGDLRTSINQFFPYGWVAMNNGSIGNASSNATARANADTFQLFSLLWSLFSIYTSGTSNSLAQMVNSSGTPVAYGASAIADFNANNALFLTSTLGRVLMGAVPASALTTQIAYQTTFVGDNNGAGILRITTANSVNYYNGMPITFSANGGTLPGGIVANTVYYVSNLTGTTSFNVSTTYANAIALTRIAYSSNSIGSPIVSSVLAGSLSGEYSHTMLLSELVQHTHDPGNGTAYLMQTTVGNGLSSTTVTTPATSALTTGNVTGLTTGQPFNVTQPGYFMNIFMKL